MLQGAFLGSQPLLQLPDLLAMAAPVQHRHALLRSAALHATAWGMLASQRLVTVQTYIASHDHPPTGARGACPALNAGLV